MADADLRGLELGVVVATTAGGTGRHVRAVVDAAVGAGAHVLVAGPAATDTAFGFSSAGATFRDVPIAPGIAPVKDVVAWRRARAALRGRPLVHAHGLRAGFVASAALPRDVPLVVTWHNAVLGGGARARALSMLERRVARRADVTLCVSADLVRRVDGLGGRDVRLAPVGSTMPSRSGADPAVTRASLGVGDGERLVLAIGRLHPQKGFDVLVHAAASLDPAQRVRVVVAGDGPERAALEELVRRTGAPVDLIGWRTDTGDLLAAADLVVLPSRWEGSPLSAHETLLAGRPLLATAVGGLPELLGDGAAELVPAEDPAAFAAAMSTLLTDDVRRAALAAAGLARGGGWPDGPTAARRVLDVYAELAAGR